MKKINAFLCAICLLGSISCKKMDATTDPVNDQPVTSLAIPDSVQKFKLTPSASAVSNRLQFNGTHNDMQATGFYVKPNSSITLTVKSLSGTNTARLAIGTPFRDDVRPVRQYFNLTNNTQTFTADSYGGIAYIIYTANDYTSSGEIEVTFGNGFKPIPYYQKGKTTHQQWTKTLDSLKSSVPDVMFISDHTIMVANMDEALLYKNEDQNLIVSRLDSIIGFENKISGLAGRTGVHATPDNKFLITVRDSASGGYMAASIAIFYTEALSYRMLQPKNLSNTYGWGLWHELGHTYQQRAWTWSGLVETTVNVYSMAVERGFKLPVSRVTTNKSWPKLDAYLAKPVAERNYNSGDNDLKLIMFHQLWLAFGDDLFIQLSKLTREERPALANDMEKMRYFMIQTSKISQRNLSDFYRKWGFKVNESVYQEIESFSFSNPEKDIMTLRD